MDARLPQLNEIHKSALLQSVANKRQVEVLFSQQVSHNALENAALWQWYRNKSKHAFDPAACELVTSSQRKQECKPIGSTSSTPSAFYGMVNS